MRRPFRFVRPLKSSSPVKRPRFNLNEFFFGPAAPDNPLVDEPEPERRQGTVVWEMNDMMRRSTRPPMWKRKRDWEA